MKKYTFREDEIFIIAKELIDAYNNSDLNRMMTFLDTGIRYQKIIDGGVVETAVGIQSFMDLVQKELSFVKSHKKTFTVIESTFDTLILQVFLKGSLGRSLYYNIKEGEWIYLNLQSTYKMITGKITDIKDEI